MIKSFFFERIFSISLYKWENLPGGIQNRPPVDKKQKIE